MTSHEENAHVLVEAWKLMVSRLPGATIEHSQGLASTFAHVPLPFLNMSIQDRATDDLAGLLSLAKERGATCAQPSLVVIYEPWVPADWERVATEAGFAVALGMTGMAASEELRPPRRPLPDLELRRITSDATARDLGTVNAHAYGMPPELFDCIANMHLWHEDSYGYVGYVDGRPVTAASTFPVAGTVYVALVATMPDSHGKGYADAVMRKAVEEGRRGMGLMRSTLHATDMGQPVYRAMGFESGGRWMVLAPAGH